jgi:hypothetical protein
MKNLKPGQISGELSILKNSLTKSGVVIGSASRVKLTIRQSFSIILGPETLVGMEGINMFEDFIGLEDCDEE